MTPFTKEDSSVLARIQKLDELGRTGARLLLGIKVFDLVSAMGSPAAFSVTLLTEDWNAIATGIRGLAKMARAAALSEVLKHLEAGTPPPVGEAREYFEFLAQRLAT